MKGNGIMEIVDVSPDVPVTEADLNEGGEAIFKTRIAKFES